MQCSAIDLILQVTGKVVALQPDQKVVIRAGKVLTGRQSGGRVLYDQAVVVEDGVISAVMDWGSLRNPT